MTLEAQIEIPTTTQPVENVPTQIDKRICDLSKAEYAKILDDIKNGVVYSKYDIKTHKNGKSILINKSNPSKRKKAVDKTIAQHAEDDDSHFHDRIYLTNEQLLMEHIIEAKTKLAKMEEEYNVNFEKLFKKNRKRKDENEELIKSYYHDMEEDHHENEKPVENKTEKKTEDIPKQVNTTSKLMGWRNRFRKQ